MNYGVDLVRIVWALDGMKYSIAWNGFYCNWILELLLYFSYPSPVPFWDTTGICLASFRNSLICRKWTSLN